MRIRTTKTKNGRLFYVIKTYYDTHGKEHSITVEKLGNENDIRAKYNCDPDEWAKAHVAELNEQEKIEKADIEISFSPKSLISKNHQYSFNIGYLFLQSLYYQLGLDRMCNEISKKYKFDFNLDDILSRLIYGRILQPASKASTCRFAKTLLEQPKFDNHQVYRALDVLAEESDFIQETIYSNSFELGKRHCGVIYYDCTNFFFEIEEADENGYRQYGKEEEQYDGFYAVVTNLDDDPCEIIKVNKQRWRIEECFRIMKTEFKSRPVYVQKDNRIEAHFITCYIALVLYRYLEKRLNGKYTCEEIIDALQSMNVTEVVGEGYIPAYTRTELTDDLHEIFGFRTDYRFLTKPEIKKILKLSKAKRRYAKN